MAMPKWKNSLVNEMNRLSKKYRFAPEFVMSAKTMCCEIMSSVPGHIEIQSWYTIMAVNAVKKKKCISASPWSWKMCSATNVWSATPATQRVMKLRGANARESWNMPTAHTVHTAVTSHVP